MELKEKFKINNSKKILLNSYKLRTKMGYRYVRPVQSKNNRLFFMCYDPLNLRVVLLDALHLNICGEAKICKRMTDGKLGAEIQSIRIYRKFRDGGLGSQMMKFIEDSMKKENISQISLYVGEGRANTRHSVLEKWYLDLGYTKIPKTGMSLDKMLKTNLLYKPSNIKKLEDVFGSDKDLHFIPEKHKIARKVTRQDVMKNELERNCD